MPAKIVVEADTSNEVLKLLGAIAEAPAREVEGRAKAYTGVTDLAEALKSTLPTDLAELEGLLHDTQAALDHLRSTLHQRIDNIEGTFNEFSLKSNVGCKHEPALLTCDNTEGLYNNGALVHFESWRTGGKPVDERKQVHYRLDGEPCTIDVFICKKCGNLYPVVTKIEEVTDPDLDSSCGP